MFLVSVFQAVLSLYVSGLTTNIVTNPGDGVSHTVPVSAFLISCIWFISASW